MLAACAPADNEPSSIVGFLEDDVIDEASGLAASHNDADTLWVINDDGPAVLHAISSTGKKVARVKLADARNRDWEDLASFRLRGDAYLLVADIGDNLRRRDELTLYLLPEPDTNTSRTSEVRRIRFHYPDGPRDAEAIAVDVAKERALILSKRDIPAVLYSVSLADSADAQQTAVRLGVVSSLPQPSREDVASAPFKKDWHWQPTAMDIASDGSSAIILTYAGVYLYRRAAGEDWIDALQRQPEIVSRSRNKTAESIAFNVRGDAVYITLEQRNAPLFRLDLMRQ
jgi:hypothetical protein